MVSSALEEPQSRRQFQVRTVTSAPLVTIALVKWKANSNVRSGITTPILESQLALAALQASTVILLA